MPAEKALVFFAKYIETELGIVYAEHNYFQLQQRLEDIAKLMNVAGLSELHAMAQSGIWGQFRQLLLDTATNNETSFFRDSKLFPAIEALVLARIAKPGWTGPVRIWSAASSTGQEALSVAMTLLGSASKSGVLFSFQILGTDISERVLERAKAAAYTQLEVQRGLPAPLMLKYFKKDDKETWTANSELTKFTEFKKLNLKEKFNFPQPFDLVLCRNVLIYQKPESKREIITRLTEALADDGYLVLGSGESLIGLSDAYDTESVNGAIVYRKRPKAIQAAG